MIGPGDSKLQVGFRDMVGFGVGVAIPLMMTTMALIVALFVVVGADSGPGMTIGMTAGLACAFATEMLRRYVLLTRPSRGQRAVMVLRGVCQMVMFATPAVALLVAAGLLSGCYGHACDLLTRILMITMLVVCVVSLPMLPLGWRLLHRATWLQPRPG